MTDETPNMELAAIRDRQRLITERDALVAEVRRLRGESLHWKRVAMAEAGFSADVIAAVTSGPRPLDPEEMNTARRLADEWAERRGLKLTQPTAPSAPTVKCRTCMDLKSVIDHANSSVAVMVRVPCPDCAPSPTVPATCATCGGEKVVRNTHTPRMDDPEWWPCPDCAGRAK